MFFLSFGMYRKLRQNTIFKKLFKQYSQLSFFSPKFKSHSQQLGLSLNSVAIVSKGVFSGVKVVRDLIFKVEYIIIC